MKAIKIQECKSAKLRFTSKESEIMYIPIKWILKDLNEAMRSKKTKEAIKRGEAVSGTELYPPYTFLEILIILICVGACLPETLLSIKAIIELFS